MRAGDAAAPSGAATGWLGCLAAGGIHTLFFVLAFPPYDWWVLTFVAPFPLVMLALRTTHRRRAVLSVFLMSTLGFYWLNRWGLAVSMPGYLLLPPFHGLIAASFVWILASLRPRGRAPVLPGVTNVFLVPIVWVGLETLRGRVIAGGYPWFLSGHPLIHAPVLCQSADLLGSYFISFLAVLPSGFAADVLTVPLFRKGRMAPTFRNALVFFLLMELVTIGYGVVSLKASDALEGRQVRIAALQTNVAQDNKLEWSADEEWADFVRFVELTLALGGLDATGMSTDRASLPIDPAAEVDLIVWPETMVPGAGFNSSAVELTRAFTEANNLDGVPFTRYHDALNRVAQILDVPMIVGASAVEGLRFEKVPAGEQGSTAESPRYERVWDQEYNSAFLVMPDKGQLPVRYDKMHLTPFGEVIPLLHRWPNVQKWFMGIGASGMEFTLSPGQRPQRLALALGRGNEAQPEETILVGTPICYESAISPVCRRLVYQSGSPKADLLITLTNDGWFGPTAGGREQHLQIGRFRCIENRVPMIRAANTGISAAIDSSGRLIQYGPTTPAGASAWMSEGAMVATVRLDRRLSMYRLIGDAFGWLCLGLTCLLLAALAAARALGSERSGGANS